MSTSTEGSYEYRAAYSAEDGGYKATCTEFPTLSAFGKTEADAVAEIAVVVLGTVHVYRQKGWKLPQPRAIQGS